MNVDLAMMALEGLAKSPIAITRDGDTLVIEGTAAALKEVARLFLLLAGGGDEELDLQPGVHVTAASPRVVMRVR